jgi:hypothetical protein
VAEDELSDPLPHSSAPSSVVLVPYIAYKHINHKTKPEMQSQEARQSKAARSNLGPIKRIKRAIHTENRSFRDDAMMFTAA